MKLLKIILFIFAVYFIRRFIQMYKVMKKIQEEQVRQAAQNQPESKSQTSHSSQEQIVEAEFKVIK